MGLFWNLRRLWRPLRGGRRDRCQLCIARNYSGGAQFGLWQFFRTAHPLIYLASFVLAVSFLTQVMIKCWIVADLHRAINPPAISGLAFNFRPQNVGIFGPSPHINVLVFSLVDLS